MLFFGMHEFHMSRESVLRMRYGEMIDLIACLAVYNGNAEEKHKHRRKMTYDEVMQLR